MLDPDPDEMNADPQPCLRDPEGEKALTTLLLRTSLPNNLSCALLCNSISGIMGGLEGCGGLPASFFERVIL